MNTSVRFYILDENIHRTKEEVSIVVPTGDVKFATGYYIIIKPNGDRFLATSGSQAPTKLDVGHSNYRWVGSIVERLDLTNIKTGV